MFETREKVLTNTASRADNVHVARGAHWSSSPFMISSKQLRTLLLSGLLSALGILFDCKCVLSCPISSYAGQLTQLLLHENHPEEALEYLSGLIKKYNDPLLCILKSRVYKSMKNEIGARRELQEALSKCDEGAYDNPVKADLLAELGFAERAIDCYSSSLKNCPDSWLTMSILAKVIKLESKLKQSNSEKYLQVIAKAKQDKSTMQDRIHHQLVSSMKVIQSKGDLDGLLCSENPFDEHVMKSVTRPNLRQTNSVSGRQIDVSNLSLRNYGYKSGQEFLVAALHLDPSRDFDMSRKVSVKGYKHLYKYPWGFLELIENAGKIEAIAIRKRADQLTDQLTDQASRTEGFLDDWFFRENKSLEQKNLLRLAITCRSLEHNDSVKFQQMTDLIESREYDKALALCGPDDLEWRIQIYLKAGKYKEVLNVLDEKHNSIPDDYHDKERLLRYRIEALIGLRRFADAEDLAAELMKSDSYEPAENKFLKAKIAVGLNQKKLAMKKLEEVIPLLFESHNIKERDRAAKLLEELKLDRKSIGLTPSDAAIPRNSAHCMDDSVLVIKKDH